MRRLSAVLAVGVLAAGAAGAQVRLDDAALVDVRVVGDGWLCAVVDPTAAILARRDADEPARADMARALADLKSGKNTWYYDKSVSFHTLACAVPVRADLARRHAQAGAWTVNGKTPGQVTFFPYAVDGFPREKADFTAPGDGMSIPRVADYVFLRLAGPLQDGQAYAVRLADGPQRTLAFDSRRTLCWALKVNQLGYRPASAKTAWLGQWLGFAGAADFHRLAGRPFQVCRYADGQAAGEPVFTGAIAAGGADETNNLTGESLCALDFSALCAPGRYCVVVPGLGRSWPFDIDEAVYGDAFYHVARGLYHQRGTIALGAPCTAWVRPEVRRPIYRSGFLPETDRFYSADYARGTPAEDRIGFRDGQGRPVSLSQFTMIQATATTEPFPGLTGGGWHDAADFDRRVGHYECVWDLLGAYEMFPSRFADGQWNIPESGNGIPDVLDEAAVQVDFFLRTQDAAGGVASWMEQTSHPGRRAEDDTMPYYISRPDRAGSLAFAAAAACLSRLIAPFAAERAQGYRRAAERAFAYGIDPAHRITNLVFTIPPGTRDGALTGQTLTFNERRELPTVQGARQPLCRLLAAVQLFAATGAAAYRDEVRAGDFCVTALQALPGAIPPFAFVTPLLQPEILSTNERARVLARLREEADQYLAGSRALPYRMLWREPSHRYFQHMAWGAVHGPRVARWPLLLWRVTQETGYEAALLDAANWELGGNPLGRSLTTGLGSVFPVVLQHHQSYYDDILEPVPGITPYAFTYGATFQTWSKQLAAIDAGHGSVKSFFTPVATCFLPAEAGCDDLQAALDQLCRDAPNNWAQTAALLVRDRVGGRLPTLHRQFIHPHEAPGQNEFTINESISSHLPLYAALVPDGWKPGPAQLQRRPRSRAELVFYPQP